MSSPFDLSVYGILDPERCRGRDLAALAGDAVRGGATFLQLRNKRGASREFIEQARAVLGQISGSGVPLVINDRVDVALAANAHGVHIGAHDMTPEDARSLLGPRAIVGVTVHSVAEAKAVPVTFADYFGVGAVYVSPSKSNRDAPIGLDGFGEIARALRDRAAGARIVGIAGIDHDNAADVIAAGADGVAVISCLFMAPDVETATRALCERVAEVRGEGAR